jgi:hypothetical protein
MKRKLSIIAAFLVVIGALGFGSVLLDKKAAVQAAGPQAPRFEVDPMWPKPLPNHWLLGMTIGLSIDDKDHIWIVHRQGTLEANETHLKSNPEAPCCKPAPPVLEFDEEGNLINHWGGPGEGYDWPLSMHGILIDYKGNVWLGGNGAGGAPAAGGEEGTAGGMKPYHDNEILKFTQDGKFLMQIGKPNHSKGSNDTENVKGVAQMIVDPSTNELYAADGYGNKRVIVFDADTGKAKRYWGAYGNKPDDTDFGPYNPSDPPDQQFRNPVHCVIMSNDRLLYVCDRVNDRIQVFNTDGKFVKEAFVEKQTKGNGSVWELAFSKDPQQTYMYLSDGDHDQVHILLRSTLQVLTSFGDGGRQPGQFYAVHSIATDSKGNIFTTETFRGQRIQKFLYKGLGPVTTEDEGVLWPKVAKSH